MCGFVGALAFRDAIEEHLPALQAGLAAIRHRGPDASAFFADRHTYIGHNRLSIIDLTDAASQPLRSVTSDAWLVYNGEIYNFAELRRSLEPRTRFVTRSDTEVLLEGYLAEGVSFFTKVRGIYAFAILDRRGAPQLVLGRDPAGVKPLYYSRNTELFVFGSEIKALLPSLNGQLTPHDEVIKTYLNLGYCPEPFTAYREILALRPGHVLVVSTERSYEIPVVTYAYDEQNDLSFQENVEQVSTLLRQAVRRNLVADVETAVALSGGIDSSLIYAYATSNDARIRGLTVCFSDPRYDEAGIAERYAEQLSGRQLTLPVDADFGIERLGQLFSHFDQPFADTSSVPIYYLTKATRQYTKVLLGGDGGDELFNGYASLARLPIIHRVRQLGFAPVVNRLLTLATRFANPDRRRALARAKTLVGDDSAEMLFDWLSWLPRHTRYQDQSPFRYPAGEGLAFYQELFRDVEPQSFSGRLMFEHFAKLLLGDYLRKTDMMSMLNGVEYRVPLLDEDLVRCALAIPFAQKSSWTRQKRVLRHLHRQIFSDDTSSAPKRGFEIPLDVYLPPSDVRRMRDIVCARDSFVRSYIRGEYLGFAFDAVSGVRHEPHHLSREGAFHRALLFYSLELWHRNFMFAHAPSAGDAPRWDENLASRTVGGGTVATVH
jgi:asparagine synthase (glutamine-hydrolysing)